MDMIVVVGRRRANYWTHLSNSVSLSWPRTQLIFRRLLPYAAEIAASGRLSMRLTRTKIVDSRSPPQLAIVLKVRQDRVGARWRSPAAALGSGVGGRWPEKDQTPP